MDPLSVTASVVSLTAICVQTAKALNDLRGKLQSADLTIAAICTEATIISASLSRIQSSMLGSPDGLSDKLSARPDLEATLDQALTGCCVVFDVLQAEIRKLTESAQSVSSDLGLKARLRFLWSESTMQDILTQLRGLQTALTLLLQLLGTDTMAEMKQIMDNNTTVLSQIVQRTSHFRTARAPRAPQSIFDASFETRSIYYGDGSSTISSTLFSFDDELVNSQIYRQVLAKAYAHSNEKDQTQSAVGSHGEIQEADQVLSHAQQSSDPENPASQSPPAPTDTALDNSATLSEAARSLAISEGPVLSPTPSDPLMEFMFEKQTYDEDWVTLWAIQLTDLGGVSRNEVERQNILHEIIATERSHLRMLQTLRYLYKYRFVLDFSTSMDSSLTGFNFPGCEDIFHANKTLLYDPLKSRQASEGPWISSFWDIFQNWLRQSGEFYLEYCSLYPMVHSAIRKEAKQNARFSRFLDQSREHRFSNRLTWETYLKTPIVRLQRYSLLLAVALKRSDRSNPRHKCGELEELIEGIKDLTTRCDAVIEKTQEKADIADFRSRMGEAGERVMPADTELEFIKTMLYTPNRFRDKIDVTVLGLRRPERCVIVLKEVRPKAIGESTYEVLAEVRGHLRLYISREINERTQQCEVRLVAHENDREVNSITLFAPSRSSAEEFGEAVEAIGGRMFRPQAIGGRAFSSIHMYGDSRESVFKIP